MFKQTTTCEKELKEKEIELAKLKSSVKLSKKKINMIKDQQAQYYQFPIERLKLKADERLYADGV